MSGNPARTAYIWWLVLTPAGWVIALVWRAGKWVRGINSRGGQA